jgi:hypothetical protein
VAYGCAADERPCELTIRDAHRRVLQRWLMVRRRRLAREGCANQSDGEVMSQKPTAPTGSSQPVAALRRANRVRRTRAQLKTRVACGELSAAEVILRCPSEIDGMPIAQLLVRQPGWGDVRTLAFLAEVRVREDKSIGSLTERQRRVVASLLLRPGRSGHAGAVGGARGDKR